MDEEIEERIKNIGFLDYLVKPVDIGLLEE